MIRFEKQLKQMLRGQLAESERLELEGWFLSPDLDLVETGMETIQKAEREILAAWDQGELLPSEAEEVLVWCAANCRSSLTEALSRHVCLLDAVDRSPGGDRWVM